MKTNLNPFKRDITITKLIKLVDCTPFWNKTNRLEFIKKSARIYYYTVKQQIPRFKIIFKLFFRKKWNDLPFTLFSCLHFKAFTTILTESSIFLLHWTNKAAYSSSDINLWTSLSSTAPFSSETFEIWYHIYYTNTVVKCDNAILYGTQLTEKMKAIIQYLIVISKLQIKWKML